MFVVVWNKTQNDWLKVETLDEHIQSNLKAFTENRLSTFLCLGVFPTHEDASQFCSALQAIRNQRIDNG